MSTALQQFGRFALSVAERRLLVDGEPVALGSRAFDLLAALVARRERVVPKEELIGAVWPGLIVEDNNLNVQISALRKVLGAQSIATVPGRGFQFTVAATAPVAASAPAAPIVERRKAAAPDHSGLPRRSRLLVADDNKVNRLLLCRSLALMGHEVDSAGNGREALEKLGAQHHDLLLLDLEMPELDGYAVLERRAADAALSEVPVIVTSSVEGVAQVARCIELGADDYLHKPVNPVLLKARVDSSLERKHLRDRQHELLARLAPDGVAAADTSHGGVRAQVTMLVARLHGFDAPAAPAQDTLDLLSSWTTLMLDAIEEHGGRVHEIGGDTLGAVFGAPGQAVQEGGAPWAAACAAREMLDLAALFNTERVAAQKPPVALCIGLASGEVVAGYAGSPRRAAYVCVGPAVHRAAEFEAVAARLGAAVLVDGATRAALAGRLATDEVPAAMGLPEPAWSLKAG